MAGKVTEKFRIENEELKLMLNGIENKAKIDEDIDEEFDRPIEVECKDWYGIQTPVEIWNLCDHLRVMLTDNGKFCEALVYQIYNTALVGWLTNKLSTDLIAGRRIGPLTNLTTASESFRRSLGGLGLIVDSKKVSIDAAETNSPLSDMLTKLQDDGDKKIIKKKSK